MRSGASSLSARSPSSRTDSYDVAIVGAGDVGSAIARELARFDLRIALIEGGADVGAGTSKANTAILHTGFDAKPGSLEARLVARGHDQLLAYAEEVGIPLERTGALLVAWDAEQFARFGAITENAERCGYERVREVGVDELYEREPNLGPGAVGALEVPDEHIVCPFTPPLAFATQAVLAGVDLRRSEPVTGLERVDGQGWVLETPRGAVTADWVVNAAGPALGRGPPDGGPRRVHGHAPARRADRLRQAEPPACESRGAAGAHRDDQRRPRRADGVRQRDARADRGRHRAQGRHELDGGRPGPPAVARASASSRTSPGRRSRRCTWASGPPPSTPTTSWGSTPASGTRGPEESGRQGSPARWRSPSTCATSSTGAGLALRESRRRAPELRMPNIGEAGPRPYAQPERIAEDPDYGRVVCFCERVTRGEIRDAAASPVPPTDLDGLRRRTRVLMGRCQGFFCGAHVGGLLAELSDRDVAEIMELPE